MPHEVLDELPCLDVPEAHDGAKGTRSNEVSVGEAGDRCYTSVVLIYARHNQHKLQHTQLSKPPINTTIRISMPYVKVSDQNTHTVRFHDRQCFVLPGLDGPDAHGVVPGAGYDEAAVARKVEGGDLSLMTLKDGDDALVRNVHYLWECT